MERAAVRVDVPTVRRDAHRDYLRSDRAKQFRPQLAGGAVRAVQNDAEAVQVGPVNHFAAQEIQVIGVERSIGGERKWILRGCFAAMFENVGLQLLFNGIGEFHAGMREKLHAIVLKGIVRGGNHDAGLKIALADQASDARRSDNSGESNGCARLGEARSKERCDVRAGFPRVHADEHSRGTMLALEVAA